MEFDSNCYRCWRIIPVGTEIGGSYGGVICTNHRSCHPCWFRSKYWRYGKRKHEPKQTKRIALCNKPRNHSKTKQGEVAIQCFGCFYRVPFHTSTEAKLNAAEQINEDQRARNTVRRVYRFTAQATSKVVKKRAEEGIKYKDYFDFSTSLRRCASHQLLAIRRAEAEGVLKVKIQSEEHQDGSVRLKTERSVHTVMFGRSNPFLMHSRVRHAALHNAKNIH